MTTWWNKNVKNNLETFFGWVKDFNNPNKVYCRNHVIKKNYKSILDCGCGFATEYYGYKYNDNYDIKYTGADSCKYFIDFNASQGIHMVEADLDCTLPIGDNAYECVFCREVVEHLSYYENAINEFIRIGKKEVIIVWFLKPGSIPLYDDELPESLKQKPWTAAGEDQINYWEEEDLYHNVYAIDKIEKFILSNPKVEKITWHDFTDKESVLHITLKEAL